MAQGNEQLAQDGLLMAASIHDMPEQGKTKRKKELVLQLTNTTSNDVTYKKGQVIGHVEAVSIDTVKQHKCKNSKTSKRVRTCMTVSARK